MTLQCTQKYPQLKSRCTQMGCCKLILACESFFTYYSDQYDAKKFFEFLFFKKFDFNTGKNKEAFSILFLTNAQKFRNYFFKTRANNFPKRLNYSNILQSVRERTVSSATSTEDDNCKTESIV